MRKRWVTALNFWMAAWAALAVMAVIPAGQAVSNLQSWAQLFGLTELARYLGEHASLDRVALAGGFVNTTLILIRHLQGRIKIKSPRVFFILIAMQFIWLAWGVWLYWKP